MEAGNPALLVFRKGLVIDMGVADVNIVFKGHYLTPTRSDERQENRDGIIRTPISLARLTTESGILVVPRKLRILLHIFRLPEVAAVVGGDDQ